jgi:hypothetical protein
MNATILRKLRTTTEMMNATTKLLVSSLFLPLARSPPFTFELERRFISFLGLVFFCLFV